VWLPLTVPLPITPALELPSPQSIVAQSEQ
jgi:hypothetical protein